jgi:hypothetical protein
VQAFVEVIGTIVVLALVLSGIGIALNLLVGLF